MKIQQHLKTQQRKIAWFARQKSRISRPEFSEELEVLAKAKDVISEKTDDSEYRDNRSMLSSSGGLAIELTKSENSIGLTQLASRVVSTMHAETSNGDDPFAKVKGLISDMITRLEEKASEDLYLMTSMISLVSRSWPEVMNIHPFDAESNTINYMEMLNFLEATCLVQVLTRARCSRQTAFRVSTRNPR